MPKGHCAIGSLLSRFTTNPSSTGNIALAPLLCPPNAHVAIKTKTTRTMVVAFKCQCPCSLGYTQSDP